jgi:ABC-2 type transport system permease protein
MNKTWLIIQREYLTRVKKKSFLLTTILVPLIIIGFYAAIIAISVSGSTNSQKIAVLDEDNLFNGKMDTAKANESTYTFIQNETEQSFKDKYKAQGYSSFLYVPKLNIDKPFGIKLHSQSSVSLSDKAKIESIVDKAIEAKRMAAAQIDPEKYKAISADITIDNTIDSANGEKKAVAGVAYGVSFAAGILIYMILLIYGMMVMRGVMEEKINRIAEVIVSSVKPFQLMLGKILGIGAVGLTQFGIWIILMFLLQMIIPVIFPGMFHQLTAQTTAMQAAQGGDHENMLQTISEGIKSLPIGLMVFCFIFYFLGGYLIYASLFAAVGSAVSEDQQEAQQLTFPIMMPIILGFVIMTKAVNDPNSGLAIFGSLFPLTSPIVMMGRIAYNPPAWQIILSMIFLILGFLFFTWLTAKIYRTGILMYGKKASWKEMWKWAFRKN